MSNPRELYLERSKFDLFFKVVDGIQKRVDSIYAAYSMEYVGTRNEDKFVLVREVTDQDEVERLRAALDVAIDALTSISSTHKPRHDTEEYWNKINHKECATVLATDTKISRNTLKEITKIIEEGKNV